MRPRLKFFYLSLGLSLFIGCKKRTEYSTDYNLFVNTEDPVAQLAIKNLVEEYNAKLGAEKLFLTRDPEAMSYIHFRKGLQQSDGKIGYGQWLKVSETGSLMGRRNDRVRYGMRIEFDADHFAQRMNAERNSQAWQELEILFSHETGHGLQMDHDPDPRAIMFATVHTTKNLDWKGYFEQARAFFNRNL